MSSILQFRPREPRPKPNPAGTIASKPATVIMFTGVRYERTAPTETGLPRASSGWMSPLQSSPVSQA